MNDDMVEGDKINTKTAPRVFLGGGVEAGAWAAELESLGVSQGALIVSDQPPGAAPYDVIRGITRSLLDPRKDMCRTFDGLPLSSITHALGSEAGDMDLSLEELETATIEKPQTCAWYSGNGFEILWGLTLLEARLDEKVLIFSRTYLAKPNKDLNDAAGDGKPVDGDGDEGEDDGDDGEKSVAGSDAVSSVADGEYDDGPILTVHFHQLCIGTGTAPVKLLGCGPVPLWTADCAVVPKRVSGLFEADSVARSLDEDDDDDDDEDDDAAGGDDAASANDMEEEAFAASVSGGGGRQQSLKEANFFPQEGLVGMAPGLKLTVNAPADYGFGSVHYLGDVGDATKLVHALQRPEDDGQETCFSPVVVVGGGPRALEVCSSLSSNFPDLPLVLVLPEHSVLPAVFGEAAGGEVPDKGGGGVESGGAGGAAGKRVSAGGSGSGTTENACAELATFYEAQLVKRGIKLAKGFRVVKTWDAEAHGSFCTLEGPPMGLKATRPRHFSRTPPQFKHSRGLVLSATNTSATSGNENGNGEVGPEDGKNSGGGEGSGGVPGGGDAAAVALDCGDGLPGEVYLTARLSIVCTESAPFVPQALLVGNGLLTVPPPAKPLPNLEPDDPAAPSMPPPIAAANGFAPGTVVVVPSPASGIFPTGALAVDGKCRTSHPSDAVFACGRCAAYPLALVGGAPNRPPGATAAARGGGTGGAGPAVGGHRNKTNTSSSSRRRGRHRKVEAPYLLDRASSFENCSEMARFVARQMVEDVEGSSALLQRLKHEQRGRDSGLESVDEGTVAVTGSIVDGGGSHESSAVVSVANDAAAGAGGAAHNNGASSPMPAFKVEGLFSPIPFVACEMLELDWRFAGTSAHAQPVLVGSTQGYPKFFACVWVRDNHLVGVFLEAKCSAVQRKQYEAAMHTIAEQRPRIINVKKLKKVKLEALLADPFCLVPPPLGVGEFLAELDDDAVFDAFRYFDVNGGGLVKTSSLGPIMAELGSDWDADETSEAEAAMDPMGKGTVSFETFRAWWMS